MDCVPFCVSRAFPEYIYIYIGLLHYNVVVLPAAVKIICNK